MSRPVLHPRIQNAATVGRIIAEIVKIRLDAAESEKARPNPVIDNFCNNVEAVRVSAFHACVEAAADEEVTVDQLVQECGEEQPTVVFWVFEDGAREHDECLVAATLSVP